jgi:hypothetical protein
MPVQINTGHDIKGHKALQRPDLDIDLPLYPPLTSHQRLKRREEWRRLCLQYHG